jgi:hypothetical protein
MANALRRCYGVDQLCDLWVPGLPNDIWFNRSYVLIIYMFETASETRIVRYEMLYISNMMFMLSEYGLHSRGSTWFTSLIHLRFKSHRPARLAWARSIQRRSLDSRDALSTAETHSMASNPDGIRVAHHRDTDAPRTSQVCCSSGLCLFAWSDENVLGEESMATDSTRYARRPCALADSSDNQQRVL